ncbi:uncharacterized protein BCR38DRAFT_481245 [Pseudomassariella vexata]|uniref:Uncharacterized protein n=1 Tax=Pseudomassariella vexata TaxID=1141098 RepID=A0A1Y2EFQ8_9PEZI|nr:uncharacterized protein BCR38DRAFT_481245 [Pseudomassariella vexata]ORY70096.1 hypothetical protein BCR38DRAFT_481245 [Pseudomassariella vexata]
MPPINTSIARRDDNEDGIGGSDTTMNLLITFVGLAFVALLLTATLVLLRRVRHRQKMAHNESLPQYNDVKYGDNHNRRRLTITTPDGRSSILVVDNRPMLSDPNSPPHSPNNVPEIHITFPDEHDEQGHRKNGRVMVVRVGETSVGLEPVREEQLPAYEKQSSHGFYSIDMDHIGGLKEKDHTQSQ